MADESIEITVDRDGNVKVEGFGFVGTDCTKMTAVLEEALGSVERRTMKPESRQRAAQVRKAGA